MEGQLCLDTITRHCKQFFENDEEGCIDYLAVYLPNNRCSYNTLTIPEREAIEMGIAEGRNGLGMIYVFASGNSYTYGDDTNMKGFTNTRYTVSFQLSLRLIESQNSCILTHYVGFHDIQISVGSVGKDGLHASYSTDGAGLLVSAPGGDHEDVTTHVAAEINSGSGCTDAGVGTSFSCPLVSGVVALMLQARPPLTWRDVQGILATTSRIIAPADSERDPTRVRNAAGLEHSHKYGFGVVDAEAAVQAAETWSLYGPELSHSVTYDTSFLVPTDGTPVSIPLQVAGLSNGLNSIEAISIELRMEHFSRGDLQITLTNPTGTVESILHPGERPENLVQDITDEDDVWELLTVRNYGEAPEGEWTLTFQDLLPNADSFTCSDIPWNIVFSDGFELSCVYMQQFEYCVDGALNPATEASDPVQFILSLTDNGLDVLEACCLCGGGQDTDSFEDTVYEVHMTIYGRDSTVVGTSAPTVPPTTIPTVSPTKMPSKSPTLRPSQSPSRAPSLTPEAGTVPTSPRTSSPTKDISISETTLDPTPADNSTSAPTLAPTTDEPTLAPTTSAPTPSPTALPSSTPSLLPSTAPSDMPSTVPSKSPSAIPSFIPSSDPSAGPTTSSPTDDSDGSSAKSLSLFASSTCAAMILFIVA